MSVSEYENALNVTLNPNGLNAIQMQESINYLRENEYNPQIFIWAINILMNTQELPIVKHATILLTHWCHNKWELVPNDFIDQLRTALFLSPILNNTTNDQSILNIFGAAQVSFVWRMYPENWPSFWSDFLQMSHKIIFIFLQALREYTKALNLQDHFTYKNFKNAMRQDGSDLLLANFIVSALDRNKSYTFDIYSYLLSWINFQYIWTPRTLEVINETMSYQETVIYSVRALAALVDRGMPLQDKMNLLASLSIAERIAAILEASPSEDTLYEIALLLNNVAKCLIEMPLELIEEAVAIFSSTNSEISLILTDFLCIAAKTNKDLSLNIFESCYVRLALFYEADFDSNDLLPTRICDVIIKCRNVNSESFDANFMEKINSADSLQDICCCLNICSSIYRDKSSKEVSIAAISSFVEVLQFSLPFENEQQQTAVSLFASFFGSSLQLFENDYIFSVFQQLVPFSEVESSLISSALISIARSNKIVDYITSDLILELASTGIDCLLTCAAVFIGYLKEGQDEVLGTIIGYVEGSLSEEDLNSSRVALCFIRSVNEQNVEGFGAYIQPFLTNYMNFFVTDDLVLSEYIQTISITLGQGSLEIILGFLENQELQINSLISLCNALKLRCADSPGEWEIHAFQILSEKVIQEFKQEKEWSTENEAKSLSISLLNSFMSFAGASYNVVGYNEQFFVFVANTFVERFDTPSVISCLISFCSIVASSDAGLASGFVIPSVSFLFYSGFDPLVNSWKSVIRLVAEFHRKICSAQIDLTPILQEIGIDASDTASYIQIFSLPKQMHGKNAIQFFREIKQKISQ